MAVTKRMIHIIGIDGSWLSPEKQTMLKNCRAIFGSPRILDMLRSYLVDFTPEKIHFLSPLSIALKEIDTISGNFPIAVLVGGDPLFFGLGKTLCKKFGPESVTFSPAVSSMQLAFARFKIPWDDATLLSVHGRNLDEVISAIARSRKVFVFTDGNNTPAVIARALMHHVGEGDIDKFTAYVAEDLGTKDEKLTQSGLLEVSSTIFPNMSVMIIVREIGCDYSNMRFGLQEGEIVHQKGLITKNEVRSAVLHALRLPTQGVMWDIGAGSGSISLESSGICPDLTIYAIESKDERMVDIRANRNRFEAFSIKPVFGTAPEVLQGLPDPDRVFVGGSGGQIKNILEACAVRLKPNGRIVVTAVVEETAHTAPRVLHRLGFSVSMSNIQVKRYNYPDLNEVSFNPITVITAEKTGFPKKSADKF